MSVLRRLAALLTLLLGAEGALACNCPTSSLANDMAEAQDVFLGVVLKVDGQKITLSVIKSIKGIARDRYEVRSAIEGVNCSISFKEGLTYLVLARDDGGTHVALFCGGTRFAGCDLNGQIAAVTGIPIPADSIYDENFPCVTPPILVGDLEPVFDSREKFNFNFVVDKEGKVAEIGFTKEPCNAQCRSRRAAFERIIRGWRFIPAMLKEQSVAYRFRELSRRTIQTTTEMNPWE